MSSEQTYLLLGNGQHGFPTESIVCGSSGNTDSRLSVSMMAEVTKRMAAKDAVVIASDDPGMFDQFCKLSDRQVVDANGDVESVANRIISSISKHDLVVYVYYQYIKTPLNQINLIMARVQQLADRCNVSVHQKSHI